MSIRDRLQEPARSSVFKNKDLVRPETIIDEDRIVGRDDQLNRVIGNLRPALEAEGLPNMLLSGSPGTGKSLIIKAVCEQIVNLCKTRGLTCGVVSLNCEATKSLDRAVYKIVERISSDIGCEVGVPESGVSTDRKFDRLYELIESHYDVVIFILDEIDSLVGPYDEKAYSSLLYQLSRAEHFRNLGASISVTALTNYTNFIEDLGTRADSSFNPDDVFFDDYDASQLRRILEHRRDAFKTDAISDEVLKVASETSSNTHGDARKAIDLLRWAGENAERRNADMITTRDIDAAQDKLNENRTLRHITGLAKQKQLALYSTATVAHCADNQMMEIPAGIAWELYKYLTDQFDTTTYGRETFVNYVTEQEIYGVLSSNRKGMGRGRGVHMYFCLDEDPSKIIDTLEQEWEMNLSNTMRSELSHIVQSDLRKY